ncbi:hypothetical protein [Bacillus mycoides]|uniref:hypothetical protein n=1 Tax=Bacillus mycoides TaxID=1405 RepID=UPI001C0259E9|nr:hypothetical protein [Bacillus mycoides]QWH80360.1 hypothetical protein EXW59_28015 [Bacillus mycoides]QWI45449.1 hypothetical protein EXW55_21510 [Bacillus mycoides]
MSFKADVLRVLIASPSDVEQERNEIETAIFKWNIQYAEQMNVVLLPSRWEEDVVPTYRGHDPQQIINEQMVNKCDILMGVFWTKLGTPTFNHSSGTLEEINIFIEQGKEVMVYFVEKDIPRTTDLVEVGRVDEYRREYGQKGIYSPYDIDRIRDHLYRKVVEYKRIGNGVEVGTVIETAIKPSLEPQVTNPISLEEIITSNELTTREILMLGFMLDTETRKFGSRWMETETIERIKRWEEFNSLTCNLWKDYNLVIDDFCDRGLIEAKEYTSEGNVRLYAMPIALYNQLRQLTNARKNQIRRVVNSYVLELPF